MGGRGSSGGSGGAGAKVSGAKRTLQTVDSFKAPAMSGSEKQISWAKDIIESPYKSAILTAERYERQNTAFLANDAAAYRAAAKRYADTVTQQAADPRITNGIPARGVIDNKASFNGLMKQLVDEELGKRRKK